MYYCNTTGIYCILANSNGYCVQTGCSLNLKDLGLISTTGTGKTHTVKITRIAGISNTIDDSQFYPCFICSQAVNYLNSIEGCSNKDTCEKYIRFNNQFINTIPKHDTNNKKEDNKMMTFKEAFNLMKEKGEKVKLPSWGGYWYWDNDKETIMIHTKEGKELDIRETEVVEYTTKNMLTDEWVVANEENCPALGGESLFGFDEAIKYVKRGLKVKRKGWNGKTQYIQLASKISYSDANDNVINVEHNDIGNKAIAFHGTSGVQLGWLASQADMLAEDWCFAE